MARTRRGQRRGGAIVPAVPALPAVPGLASLPAAGSALVAPGPVAVVVPPAEPPRPEPADRSDDVRRHDYLSEVDDLLISLPWRRRRAVLAELDRALSVAALEAASGKPAKQRQQGPLDQPARQYAAGVLEEAHDVPRVPLALRPIVSWAWPTPGEWAAAGIRGVALVIAGLYAVGIVHGIGQRLMWDGGAGFSDVWQALRCPSDDSLVEAAMSPAKGGFATVVVAWGVGQFLNGRRLERNARARRGQRGVTLLALLWLFAVVIWAAIS